MLLLNDCVIERVIEEFFVLSTLSISGLITISFYDFVVVVVIVPNVKNIFTVSIVVVVNGDFVFIIVISLVHDGVFCFEK